MARLQGKVALISGATSGIGRAAARLFAREGAKVVLGGRRKAEGETLVAEITAAGGQAAFRVTDVTNHHDNVALVQLALDRFDRLDIAFNNAGLEAAGALAEFDEAQYAQVFDTNVKGVFSSIKAQVPALTKTKGSILVTSSVAGIKGMAGAGVYVASKHAVDGIVKTAALELAPVGIRVNAVAPGPIETPMLDRFSGGHPEALVAAVPIGRLGTADEVAQSALWLASDDSKFVTGTILHISGGMTAA